MNVKYTNKGVYIHAALFCTRRLLIAVVTVFANDLTFLHLIAYTFGSLASCGYLLGYKPMMSRRQNRQEAGGEIFMLFQSYFLVLFSDFVIDLGVKNQVGRFHFYFTLVGLGANIILITREMVS